MSECLEFAAQAQLKPCPSEGLLPHLTSKWTIQVIAVLAQNARPVRFGEIQKRIDGLSRRVLAITLRTLERDGLVERHVFPDVPPRVEYRLTSTGAGFVPVLANLSGWMRGAWPKVLEARRAFDEA